MLQTNIKWLNLADVWRKDTHHEICLKSHQNVFEGVPHVRVEKNEDLVVDVKVPSLQRKYIVIDLSYSSYKVPLNEEFVQRMGGGTRATSENQL